jgi:hypothetical protein
VTGESEARLAEAQQAALAAETARAAAEQHADDEHAAAEQLRKGLAGARADYRAELEQLRADYRNDRDQLWADTAARLEEVRTAHRAQLEAVAADRTRNDPDPDSGERPRGVSRGRRRDEQPSAPRRGSNPAPRTR